jgi:C-terminal processing protease CtpA/Prc
MGFFTRITPLLFTLSPLEYIKHGRLRHYAVHFPKHRNAYQGKLSVLVNGKSFSMSCIAATYLKYKANATIIGEETGGNIAGSNAVVSGNIILPHTKVRVFIPYYHIYHSIDAINDGHGLMPDIKTTYSASDVLEGIDVDLNKVLEEKNRVKF